jgi:hypothetical protein
MTTKYYEDGYIEYRSTNPSFMTLKYGEFVSLGSPYFDVVEDRRDPKQAKDNPLGNTVFPLPFGETAVPWTVGEWDMTFEVNLDEWKKDPGQEGGMCVAPKLVVIQDKGLETQSFAFVDKFVCNFGPAKFTCTLSSKDVAWVSKRMHVGFTFYDGEQYYTKPRQFKIKSMRVDYKYT